MKMLGVPIGVLVLLNAMAVGAQEPGTRSASSPPVTAFVNVSVIPMDRERVLANQTVIVRGGQIVALGRTSQVPVPAEALRVEGKGKFLIPGLGDCHVHLGRLDSPPEGSWPRWSQHPDVAELLFAFAANGVTTVREMHGGPALDGSHWLPALRQRVARGELFGPRIYGAGDPDPSSPAAAAKSVVALKAAGYDFVKFAHSGDSLYDSIAAAARRVGLPVAGHAMDERLADAFTDRWASVEHLFGYFWRATGKSAILDLLFAMPDAEPVQRVDDKTLRRIASETKQAGVWNCPTPTIWETASRNAFSAHVAWEVDFDRRLVKALHESGAGLLLGTDAGGPMNNLATPVPGFSSHRALELFVEAGLTPYQALETGTLNMARFFNTLDSTGTIAVGKRADLVLLKANPLVNIGNTRALAGVMVGGRWVSRTELDRRIDSMRVSSSARAGTWGSFDDQMRLLSRMLWR